MTRSELRAKIESLSHARLVDVLLEHTEESFTSEDGLQIGWSVQNRNLLPVQKVYDFVPTTVEPYDSTK